MISEQNLQTAAFDRAREIMRDWPGRPLAATFRLAAIIEAGLMVGWTQSVVDRAASLFDELDLIRARKAKTVGVAGAFGFCDGARKEPDEPLPGEAVFHSSSPVAGVDTATVGQGGEAVTASPPGRPADAKVDADAVPDGLAIAVGRAEIARRRADGFELTWIEGHCQSGFLWEFRVSPSSVETGILVGGVGGGGGAGAGAVTAQFPRRVGEK